MFGPPSSSSEESFFIARQKWTPSSKSAKEAFEEIIAIAKETQLFCYWTGKNIKIQIMLRDCHAYCSAEHRLSSEVVAFLQLPVCKRIAYHCQCQECLTPYQKNFNHVVEQRIFGKQTQLCSLHSFILFPLFEFHVPCHEEVGMIKKSKATWKEPSVPIPLSTLTLRI